MKCTKCGKEFEGNFCPQCGSPATEGNSATEGSKEILKGAFDMYLHSRLKFLFLGAFIAALCVFSMGKIVSGLTLLIAGILLMPPVLKKCQGKQRIYVIVAIAICLVVGILTGQGAEEQENLVDYVKQYQAPGISYSIGEVFEMADLKTKWKSYQEDGTDYVSVEYTEDTGDTKVIFKVEDVPELSDVLLDGESNAELYEGFDQRLFGTESTNADAEEIAEEESTDTEADNETTTDQQETSAQKQFQVGETIEFTDADGLDELLTIESCEPYVNEAGTFTRINYMIENIGDVEATTVDWDFQLYADNSTVQTYFGSENINTATRLGSGRKLNASTYYKLNPEDASVIELECNDVTIILKDENAGIDSFTGAIESVPATQESEAEEADDSLETDADVWFVTYNSFYRTRDIGGIEINVMNDAIMLVQCTGSDGMTAEWEMDLKPTEIGDEGEYIYYYGKGIKMSYYPSDHHIHVDAEDNYFGDYYPNE